MARRSPELVNVLRRILEAYGRCDVDTVQALHAETDSLLLIGSDGREWLHGFEAFAVATAQTRAYEPYRLEFRRMEAWDEGVVGWAAADLTAEHTPGVWTDYRVTAVFRLDRGVWRVVQWHNSVPDDDGVARDQELPTSLNDLVGQLDDDLERSLRARFSTDVVNVLFSDIVDSTTLAAEVGDAAWSDIVRRHFVDVASIAEIHGGSVVKTLGDGVMLVFESAAGAVRSARAIQDSVDKGSGTPFRVRIGVNSGEALAIDGDYFGQPVTVAARVAGAAASGQTLVTDATRKLLDAADGFAFGDPIVLALKGISGKSTVHPLVAG